MLTLENDCVFDCRNCPFFFFRPRYRGFLKKKKIWHEREIIKFGEFEITLPLWNFFNCIYDRLVSPLTCFYSDNVSVMDFSKTFEKINHEVLRGENRFFFVLFLTYRKCKVIRGTIEIVYVARSSNKKPITSSIFVIFK